MTEGYDFVMFTSRCGKGMVILAFWSALKTARFTSYLV